MPYILALLAKQFLQIKLLYWIIMKTNLREQFTMYQYVIRPEAHFAPELSFTYLAFRVL